jgi:hypothetical protein
MSRRWLASLLFALALAVQAFMPVANGVAAARGVDLHALVENCLNVGGADQRTPHAPGHVHGHHDCALCQAFCDGVASDAARPLPFALAPAVRWTELRWTLADRALPASPRDFARQARAPPRFS